MVCRWVLMKRERALMTPEGASRLQGELWDLRYRRIPDLTQLVNELSLGAAGPGQSRCERSLVEDLEQLRSRAAELQLLLADVEVVEYRPAGSVQFGSWVVLRHEDGNEEHYRLVSQAEADPFHGQLSMNSPLGQALLGHHVGEVVEWRSDRLTHRATVVGVD
jgi:transcription elongation factor GreA